MNTRRDNPQRIMSMALAVILAIPVLLATASLCAQDDPTPPPPPPEAPGPDAPVDPIPNIEPLPEPSQDPTEEPAEEPTEEPTEEPAEEPTEEPTEEPADEELVVPPVTDPVLDGVPEDIPEGDEYVNLNLQKTDVKDIIEYIVKWTGKVVIVQENALLSKSITVMSDHKVPKRRALELLFQAFKLNDLAVVETDDIIMIDSMNEMKTLLPGVVLGPEVDVEDIEDDGNMVIKVFQIKEAKAQDIWDRIDPTKPDYVDLTVDVNSNQIIVESDIGYAKRVSRLIALLDVEPYIAVRVETFRLRYADAMTVASLIETLFASSMSARPATTTSSRTTQRPGQRPTQGRSTQQPAIEVGTSEQLTVTVLEPTNSITVRAEPDIIDEIRVLLNTAWDIAPSREGEIFRIYDLRYTDPIKVKDLLQSLLESGGSTSSGAARGQQRGGAAQSGGADVAVANIFKIEAYPDSNRLIVISKSPDNFEWLDEMIDRIDQPLSVGLPINIELKHASAIDVAEILNALLSSGGSASITAPEEGLTGVDFSVASSDSTNSTGTASAERTIDFPWQSQRGADADSAEVSALVGKARVVPNASQNSLLVLATPEIQDAVLKIITDLDRPGRQVMITAILAEVELGDQFEFGLRFGQGIVPGQPDNVVVVQGLGTGNTMFEGTLNPAFPGSLTTSILNFGIDATVILQALDQVTNTRILQQPRIFTSDNKEAKFFDGQDVPFQSTSSQSAGDTVATFEQIAVGIGVNVRPRITKERNVAMEIEILLSNVNKNSPVGVGNNPVIDRRQTNTTITVKNGQTIVISGIRQETEGKTKRKVPILGDIPIINLLFSSESEDTQVSELVIFITPIVVDNPDENDVNFNEIDRRRLEQLTDPMGERSRMLLEQLGVGGASQEKTQGDPRRD